MDREIHDSFWMTVWREFRKKKLGSLALLVVFLFGSIAIYAPFLASSKPFFVIYDGTAYFPLFRYLFYPNYYTKAIDLFFNLLIFAFPLGLFILFFFRHKPHWRRVGLSCVIFLQIVAFFGLLFFPSKDPASDRDLSKRYRKEVEAMISRNTLGAPFFFTPQQPSWDRVLASMNGYARLNAILQYRQRKEQNASLQRILAQHSEQEQQRWLEGEIRKRRTQLLQQGVSEQKLPSRREWKQEILAEIPPEKRTQLQTLPTLWEREQANEEQIQQRTQEAMDHLEEEYANVVPLVHFVANVCFADPWNFRCSFLHKMDPKPKEKLVHTAEVVRKYEQAQAENQFITERRAWLESQNEKISFLIMPFLSHFHWEEDAGGEESINRFVQWWELTRTNGKDLVAALLFGTRISLIVGFVAVSIALIIGIPIGALAGFFGGKTDIFVYRLIEIWESMPVFFMLLLVVGIVQVKSIFIIISVIGIFSWTSYSRYIRGEFLKQRNLPYVEACRMQGFRRPYIMFSHILPNALPPVLTLLPFGIMAAITSEAGLSFLGLGEEGSCSWGVLMDEGRSAFPAESYLLWPPALFLTTLLIAIALVGDALRDALDPKMRRD